MIHNKNLQHDINGSSEIHFLWCHEIVCLILCSWYSQYLKQESLLRVCPGQPNQDRFPPPALAAQATQVQLPGTILLKCLLVLRAGSLFRKDSWDIRGNLLCFCCFGCPFWLLHCLVDGGSSGYMQLCCIACNWNLASWLDGHSVSCWHAHESAYTRHFGSLCCIKMVTGVIANLKIKVL